MNFFPLPDNAWCTMDALEMESWKNGTFLEYLDKIDQYDYSGYPEHVRIFAVKLRDSTKKYREQMRDKFLKATLLTG